MVNIRYAYHEDKLGEVIYQIFDENITGLVLHINTLEMVLRQLCVMKSIYLQKT